jgi:hypothetical protein
MANLLIFALGGVGALLVKNFFGSDDATPPAYVESKSVKAEKEPEVKSAVIAAVSVGGPAQSLQPIGAPAVLPVARASEVPPSVPPKDISTDSKS